MRSKKYMLVVELNGQKLFYSSNSKKNIAECQLACLNGKATSVELYQKVGIGYECIDETNKRRIGF